MEDIAYLDDLMYSIFYVASQGGCNTIGKVSDPKRFCGILGTGSTKEFVR